MSKTMQKEMNDLFTAYSFGGGGSSGGNSGGTLGPGGGSDPGNHPSARTGDALGTGPLSNAQHNTVTSGLIGLSFSPIGRAGQVAAAIGGAAHGWK